MELLGKIRRMHVRDNIPVEALLFQAGYLTVLQSSQPLPGQWVYTLGYPNREVESSLNQDNIDVAFVMGSALFLQLSSRLPEIQFDRPR